MPHSNSTTLPEPIHSRSQRPSRRTEHTPPPSTIPPRSQSRARDVFTSAFTEEPAEEEEEESPLFPAALYRHPRPSRSLSRPPRRSTDQERPLRTSPLAVPVESGARRSLDSHSCTSSSSSSSLASSPTDTRKSRPYARSSHLPGPSRHDSGHATQQQSAGYSPLSAGFARLSISSREEEGDRTSRSPAPKAPFRGRAGYHSRSESLDVAQRMFAGPA